MESPVISKDLVAEVIANSKPTVVGKSKEIYCIDPSTCIIRLLPSLSSYTFQREELVAGTQKLRLDFFELAVARLRAREIPTAFRYRIGSDIYIADFCTEHPFETIVKNTAIGSTIRKYPRLFEEGYEFKTPVVKIDYRTDPEDQPIAEDYVREAGADPEKFKFVALQVNDALRTWLSPSLVLLDFCIVLGHRRNGELCVTSEISPDSMRVRTKDSQSMDKDLFRRGETAEQIIAAWTKLIELAKHG